MITPDLENLLTAEIIRATALPPGKVIWSNQTRNRPASPFIELDIVSIDPDKSYDQVITDTPDPAPVGEEVTLTSRFTAGFTLAIRAYSKDVVGIGRASNLLAKVRQHFNRTQTLERLRTDTVYLAYIDGSPVLDSSELLEIEDESRASTSLRFSTGTTTTDRVTYIEKVTLNTTLDRLTDVQVTSQVISRT